MIRAEDALQSVRSAMMLGAVLPEMRQQAEALAVDLAELVRLRKQIADERDKLARDLSVLADERQRLSLLIDERQKRQARSGEGARRGTPACPQLARQAENLNRTHRQAGAGLDPTGRTARPAARASEERKALDSRPDLAALKDPGRLTPAVAFASAKGLLPLPVNGAKIKEFGAPDGRGGSEKGLSIAARPGGQITAPCDGWVVYAGTFRNYGQLLILNAGGGYHVLLAGMERISVDLGQFVVTGEPVAVMGGGVPVGRRRGERRQPTGTICGVPQGRSPRRSRPMVGRKRRRKGSRMMRKTSLILLGAAAGAALTLVATQPRIVSIGSSAQGGGRRHLPAAQPVRRRVRARARRLRREAGRRQARRIRDQRHAGRARSAFELHGLRRASATCRCRRAASSAASASKSRWKTA